MKTYVLDCTNVASFNDFVFQFNKAFPAKLDIKWCGNLDALNDYLLWPDSPYHLKIKSAVNMKSVLSYQATLAHLNEIRSTCHPSSIPWAESRIADAKNEIGQTLYDEILQIFFHNNRFLRVSFE